MDHNKEWNGVGGKTCKKFVDNKLIYNESFVRTKTLPIPIWFFFFFFLKIRLEK